MNIKNSESTSNFCIQSRLSKSLIFALMALLVITTSATAEVMYMVGTISGNVNGQDVEFGLNIKLDMETGEEIAAVTNMSPEMGAFMRQVTAMVTVGGHTGGKTDQAVHNLFVLSGGNYVNSATMFWPSSGDSLELIHKVSYTSGDTMQVEATINGTVPVISQDDEVSFADFSETLHWNEPREEVAKRSTAAAASSQVITTGVGFEGDFSSTRSFRRYLVGGGPIPGGVGKGSTTIFVPRQNGVAAEGPVSRFAYNISSTYNEEERAMNVHLFNTLTPLEVNPSASTKR